MSPDPLVRVLVLDTDPWRRRGICSALLDGGGIQIVDESDRSRPDVVLLSQCLITAGSLTVPIVHDRFPASAVLVYGDSEDLAFTAEVLAYGARGYFQLSGSPETLANAVSVVSRGQIWGSRQAVSLLVDRVTEGKIRQKQSTTSVEDVQLLALLNEGLTNKEIAQRLGIAEATVKSRLTRLYKHFHVRTRLQLLVRAIKDGVVSSAAVM